MTNKTSSGKRFLQISVLTAMLVVVPLVSWYFLKGGLDYRLDALEELEFLGTFEAGNWQDQIGEPVDTALLNGQLLVVGILPESEQASYLERLASVHDQFDNRSDVLFLTFVPADDFGTEMPLMAQRDPEQWKFISVESGATPTLSDKLEMEDLEGAPASYLALVDEQSMVRYHYEVSDNQQMGRLIKHMAILLPERPKRKERE